MIVITLTLKINLTYSHTHTAQVASTPSCCSCSPSLSSRNAQPPVVPPAAGAKVSIPDVLLSTEDTDGQPLTNGSEQNGHPETVHPNGTAETLNDNEP